MLSSSTIDAIHSKALAISRNSIFPPTRTPPTTSENHSETRPRSERAITPGPITALLPIMAAVLIAFLIIGLALPVLPLHVHQRLGLSAFVVGLVTGSQFAASLF